MSTIPRLPTELRIHIDRNDGMIEESPWKWRDEEGYVHPDGPFMRSGGMSQNYLSTDGARKLLFEKVGSFPWGRMRMVFNNREIASRVDLSIAFDSMINDYQKAMEEAAVKPIAD